VRHFRARQAAQQEKALARVRLRVVAVDGKTSRGGRRADYTRVHRLGIAEHGGHLLHLEIITGRADVILDKEGGEVQSLAIVDYKMSTDPDTNADYALQLAVYTDAGRRKGLNVSAA
jgi:ATP-dependent exoDNAse (exonuclease V) beta subunit